VTPPPFNAGKHPRAAGGKFGATNAAQAAAAGHPSGAWAAGPIQSGAAHNHSTPDDRVKALQQTLNGLGFGDERGHELLVDGKPGAHTKASIQRFQRANGMPPTGIVDAKTMVAILTAKPKPKAAPKKSARRIMSTHHAAVKRPTVAKKPSAPSAPAAITRTGSVGGKEPPAFY
jgi:peptidoglycan hydrolase-like protein with peptidoglycan-binding domain